MPDRKMVALKTRDPYALHAIQAAHVMIDLLALLDLLVETQRRRQNLAKSRLFFLIMWHSTVSSVDFAVSM